MPVHRPDCISCISAPAIRGPKVLCRVFLQCEWTSTLWPTRHSRTCVVCLYRTSTLPERSIGRAPLRVLRPSRDTLAQDSPCNTGDEAGSGADGIIYPIADGDGQCSIRYHLHPHRGAQAPTNTAGFYSIRFLLLRHLTPGKLLTAATSTAATSLAHASLAPRTLAGRSSRASYRLARGS